MSPCGERLAWVLAGRDWPGSLRGEATYESGAGKFSTQLQETSSPYLHPDQDKKLRAPARTQEGLVCERFPFLILPVRQLSREPFRKHRCERAAGQDTGPVSTEPSAEVPRASRRARRRARLEPSAEAPRASCRARRRARLESNPLLKRRERAVGQDAGPASNHPPKRYTSEPSGKPPCPSRTVCASARAATHTKPSTERSVEQAVAAEPRTTRQSSRSRRAPPIPNRTP